MEETTVKQIATKKFIEYLYTFLDEYSDYKYKVPISENWFRVTITNIPFDLSIYSDEIYPDTLLVSFYGLIEASDINNEKCWTTNFSDCLTLMYSYLTKDIKIL